MTPDLQKGTELANRYTLVRKLGAGSSTATWLATDRMTRASVALKVLVNENCPVALLREEWQTGLRLLHAHIVRVFEFHEGDDSVFYSMQFVPGTDATALSGAPLADCLPPLMLIADALRYAHGKGVVHRDIKASNVLFDRNGAPYLSDFGAASRTGAEATGGSLIAASPQSLAGLPASPSDDVFALGGLIYELVSGRSPYSSASTAEDIRSKIPAPLTAASQDAVPEEVQRLLAEMLDKDAARRPELATVISRFAAAGFEAAPAPGSYFLGPETAKAEIIAPHETVRPTSPSSMPGAAAPATSVGSGISSRTVGVSLLILIALLIGVIFVLPDTLPTRRDATTAVEVEPAGSDIPERAEDEDLSRPLPERDERVVARSETEAVLGQLLSRMETLERRAVQRWGGLRFKKAQELYEAGDEAYLARDYQTAGEKYREAIQIVDPLLDEVDRVFRTTFADATAALEAANTVDALRLFEIAVAISPSHAAAQAGYLRAKNLDTVIALTDQGLAFEKNLELAPARQAFERAVEIDPQWQRAQEGLARVTESMRQMEFDQRMTEGLLALGDGHYDAARAAFRMAQELKPGSREPADGLLQVDQGIRLDRISALERLALAQQRDEQWETVSETFAGILEIDPNLEFAKQGLAQAQQMTALHQQLDIYIANPDSLSSPSTMQKATTLLVDITRMPEIGPRLADQRDELSRLLKRAATPLTVQIVSDNLTDVSIYKVGKLGSFRTQELSLRPGTYVAVGSRPGYRDVRLEFQVGPELESRPIIVRCEEAI